jgi:hypothetical protein
MLILLFVSFNQCSSALFVSDFRDANKNYFFSSKNAFYFLKVHLLYITLQR